jgi:cyclase
MQQLTKNILVETGWSGANVGCITTKDGLVLIDTPHRPSDAAQWKKAVAGKGIIKYLINTEPHEDHTTCDFFFKAPVIAHEKARESVMSTDIKSILDIVAYKDPDGMALVKDYQKRIPSITFSERFTLYLGEHSFHLIYMPGHAVGQTAVLIPEERVVFTGDNVTNKIQGFLHDADPYAWLESIKRISAMDVDYIVPGHGGVCDKGFLKEETAFVQDCIDKIRGALNKGWTKEETIARVSFEQDLPDLYMGKLFKELLDWSVAHMYEFLS